MPVRSGAEIVKSRRLGVATTKSGTPQCASVAGFWPRTGTVPGFGLPSNAARYNITPPNDEGGCDALFVHRNYPASLDRSELGPRERPAGPKDNQCDWSGK